MGGHPTVFDEHVDKHGLAEIVEVFGKGVKVEVSATCCPPDDAERLAVPGLGKSLPGRSQRE